MIREKGVTTGYQNLVNPDFRNEQRLAEADAYSGNCAPDFFWMTILSFLTAFVGSITYGGIIVSFSPLVLLLLLFSAIPTYFIGKWQQNYTEKHKDEWTAIDRKIIYLKNMSRRFDHMKDIRMYSIPGWLTDMLSGFHYDRMIWSKMVSIRSFWGTVLTIVYPPAAFAMILLSLITVRSYNVAAMNSL